MSGRTWSSTTTPLCAWTQPAATKLTHAALSQPLIRFCVGMRDPDSLICQNLLNFLSFELVGGFVSATYRTSSANTTQDSGTTNIPNPCMTAGYKSISTLLGAFWER